MNTAISANASASPKRAKPFYARVAALGFMLIALSGVIGVLAILASGDTGENFVFGLAFFIVGLLVSAAAWSTRRWALILTAMLSLLLLALVGPFSLFTLAHPESATEFVPVVLILSGAVLGMVGSIVALAQSWRRTTREHATGAERLALSLLVGGLALAALFSVILTLTGQTSISSEARTFAVSMQIRNFAFTPQTYQAKAGETVRMVVKNDDASLHTFTLPAARVDVSVPPGRERLIEFKAPAPGVYQWYCIPHSAENAGTHEGMVGTLIVQ